ncbi:MAG: isoprenylcysteine carboxylmethyltransferase family protein [Pyrinomonadaceae bacterium]
MNKADLESTPNVERAGLRKVRRSALLFFAAQGTGVIVWWCLLVFYPESRLFFVLEPNRETSLLAFWLPDLLFMAVGSLVAAVLIGQRNKYSVAAMWLVTGAVSYAALYTSAFVLMTDRGWWGVVLMLPSMLWSGVFATSLTVENDMFRQARATSTNYVLLKTFTQIAVVWTLILVVFPYLITLVEAKLGFPRLEFAYQRPLAVVIFIAISSVGVWAAFVMSRVGKGTPLPLDHAVDLVVVGPYRYVRNPMAVSGIGQGLAVALFLGSPLVAVYALMGSAIWQLIFRPLEEDDLAERFGPQYVEYAKAIRCWIPHRSGYKAKPPP